MRNISLIASHLRKREPNAPILAEVLMKAAEFRLTELAHHGNIKLLLLRLGCGILTRGSLDQLRQVVCSGERVRVGP